MSDYERGFMAGWSAAVRKSTEYETPDSRYQGINEFNYPIPQRKKRKKPQKGKAKLLTDMTAPKWNKYKKGSGKKTYVQIRAQVSRSLEYKRACKRKGFK